MRSAVGPTVRLAAGVGLLALVLYLFTAAPGITWRSGGIDSGELTTAVATGSVAHPPGYPTYLLLGRLATLLPVEPARALAWLSAVCAALTCAGVVFAASPSSREGRGIRWSVNAAGHRPTRSAPIPRRLGMTMEQPPTSSVGVGGVLIALAPGLWLATAPLLWASATYAEVNAPAAAVTAAWLALRGWAPRPPGRLLAGGVLLGVALGIHVLLVVLAAGTALGQLGAPRARARLAALASLSVSLAAGAALTFGSLALLPPAGPVNWYAPQTANGWLLLVTADAYRGLLSPGGAPLGLLAMLRALVENLGFVGAVAAVVGLQEVLTRPGERWSGGTLLCAGLALVYVIFAAAYAARDSEAYLLPALVLLTPAAATGLRAAARALPVGPAGVPMTRASKIKRAALGGIVLAPCLANGLIHGDRLNLSGDREASRYAERVLGDAPREAVLVTSGDAGTFALWYARYALGTRPDVAVLNDDLLPRGWYRDHVTRLHVDLMLSPVGSVGSDSLEALARANPRRTVLAIPPVALEAAAVRGP